MVKTKKIKKRVNQAAASAKKAGKAARKAMDTMKSGAETMMKKAEEGAAAATKKLNETAFKVNEAITTGADKIACTVGEAIKLAQLKVELHNLKSERARLYRDADKKLRILQKKHNFDEIPFAFTGECKKMEVLQVQIAEKEI